MAETHKIRDREMYGIGSTNFIQCYSDWKNKAKIYINKYVNNVIQDLEHFGPAGLIHIIILSSIIKRPIKIWNSNGSLIKIIGRKKTGYPVDIEYHATDFEVGHWTLKGGKNPNNVITDLNSCLFSVISSQIGQDTLELRKWTVIKLKNNFQNLTTWINKIKLERNSKMIFMIGGVRYTGKSSAEAKTILDNSEATQSHDSWLRGHARGHVSDPLDDCSKLTVEKYSRNGSTKSGFLSQNDQNYVTNIALQTKDALSMMEELNKGKIKAVATVTVDALKRVDPTFKPPKVKQWINGQVVESSERYLESIVLVLRHHMNKFQDKEADVFVQTCYPRIPMP